MLSRIWPLIKDTVSGYIADNCLSRGASIAYYTIFSVAPLMVIATAIAGFFFGEEAVRGALDDQLRGLVGEQGAATIQDMVKGASNTSSGTIATIVGLVTLLLTASGVFGELQGALNAIWKVEPDANEDTTKTVSRLVRAKAASMGLVAATGFILLVSLAVSAGISMIGTWLQGGAPEVTLLMSAVNFAISLGIITLLFGAMYKILPDRSLPWRDVAIGAFVT
ncbi:YihY/virulence factor BrkB family protein, partial [Roseomonas sp. DSM 102946]|nr:YihY/virulence factor BrkB family protein [Roseomonas sp. DSM 102946]